MKMKKRPTRKKDYLKQFDYESKVWGGHSVGLKPSFLGATRLKYALGALRGVRKGKVLEVGCGAGAFARAIKKHRPSLEVSGCDLSRNSIALAKGFGGDVSYFQADVYHLPFKSDSFDAVVSFDVWEHLEKPAKAFQEVYRVLKPGGIFHFFVPTEGNKLSLYPLAPKKVYELKKRYTGHVQSFTQEVLFKMLVNSGFEVKQANNSLYLLYQCVDLAYFSFLGLQQRNVAVSVESYLQFSKGSIFDRILGFLTSSFGRLTYLENEIFGGMPGGGTHITAIKK